MRVYVRTSYALNGIDDTSNSREFLSSQGLSGTEAKIACLPTANDFFQEVAPRTMCSNSCLPVARRGVRKSIFSHPLEVKRYVSYYLHIRATRKLTASPPSGFAGFLRERRAELASADPRRYSLRQVAYRESESNHLTCPRSNEV
jgi:hypothetical protein